jgi:hypothetical protein
MESRSSRDSRAMDGRAAEEYASGSCLEANVTGTKAAAIGVWTMSKTSRVCRWHRAQPVPAPPKPTAAVRADVDRLVARATELDSLWPWKAASPEIDRVVRHGKAVAPCWWRCWRWPRRTGTGDGRLARPAERGLGLLRI